MKIPNRKLLLGLRLKEDKRFGTSGTGVIRIFNPVEGSKLVISMDLFP